MVVGGMVKPVGGMCDYGRRGMMRIVGLAGVASCAGWPTILAYIRGMAYDYFGRRDRGDRGI